VYQDLTHGAKSAKLYRWQHSNQDRYSSFKFMIDFLQVVPCASISHATLPRAVSRVITRVHRSVVSVKTATSAVKRPRKQTFRVLAAQGEKMRQNAMKKMLDMIVNIFFKAF
jgi:hypothetical protein